MGTELKIFVYGTLKRGFPNHERYCKGLLRAEPACLTGRLFKLTAQIPVMMIPDDHVLVQGSADTSADMRLQEQFQSTLPRWEKSTPEGGYRKVYGELLYFGDPETRLPSMDFLEDFQPGKPSTYNRVLASVMLQGGSETAAWVYVAGFDTQGLEEYEGEKWFPD
jgi:gamma-glutamylcyclotransferase (GGCT)/AIG2-like uncharacterized protein YtfP